MINCSICTMEFKKSSIYDLKCCKKNICVQCFIEIFTNNIDKKCPYCRSEKNFERDYVLINGNKFYKKQGSKYVVDIRYVHDTLDKLHTLDRKLVDDLDSDSELSQKIADDLFFVMYWCKFYNEEVFNNEHICYIYTKFSVNK